MQLGFLFAHSRESSKANPGGVVKTAFGSLKWSFEVPQHYIIQF
jgi:hypothetical protein